MADVLLELKNLKTSFRVKDEYFAAVDDVTLTVNKQEVVAIVGESGCGKSALAYSIMKLHTRAKVEGEIEFKGENVVDATPHRLTQLRGKEMGMIFQDSLSALNPLIRIGDQIAEAIQLHDKKISKVALKDRVMELLDKVGIHNTESVYIQYPHQLSGGMRQRVVIAIAIANNPDLLIADEPTTALDVTIQAQILDLIRELRDDLAAGVILITHDLGVVAEMADRVAVMYAGQIVEYGDIYSVMENPLHPYTRSLLKSMPSAIMSKDEKLHTIEGVVPSLPQLPRVGCRFKSRIAWIPEEAHEEHPTLKEVESGHFVRCSCYKHFHFPEEGEAL